MHYGIIILTGKFRMGKINNTYIRHADSYALAGVTPLA